ncbi:hypothetical protein Hanom_Chr12g01066441 [Helianthus anomalus]
MPLYNHQLKQKKHSQVTSRLRPKTYMQFKNFNHNTRYEYLVKKRGINKHWNRNLNVFGSCFASPTTRGSRDRRFYLRFRVGMLDWRERGKIP